MVRLLLRILAAGLFFITAQRAWAGISFYSGTVAFKAQNYQEAVSFFRTSEKWDSGNPRLFYELGRSAFLQGMKTGEEDWLKQSHLSFEKLADRLPDYGRTYAYLGFIYLTLQKRSENGLNLQEWNEIKQLFYKALEKEPGSAWIAYMTGRHFLAHAKFLSLEERQMALTQLKRSVTIFPPRRFHQASPYLKSVLSFLWNRFRDFSLLKKLTPLDPPSYRRFLEFLEQEGLWHYREEVYETYVSLKKGNAHSVILTE